MFKHILSPTDGSVISTAIIRNCITFAKQSGAMVTGLHVVPTLRALTEGRALLDVDRDQYQEEDMAHARLYLAEIERVARELGLLCKTLAYTGDQPYEVIIKTAREQGWDLICMASHGRRGIAGLLLGSETQKVLTHSQIPVLVFR